MSRPSCWLMKKEMVLPPFLGRYLATGTHDKPTPTCADPRERQRRRLLHAMSNSSTTTTITTNNNFSLPPLAEEEEQKEGREGER